MAWGRSSNMGVLWQPYGSDGLLIDDVTDKSAETWAIKVGYLGGRYMALIQGGITDVPDIVAHDRELAWHIKIITGATAPGASRTFDWHWATLPWDQAYTNSGHLAASTDVTADDATGDQLTTAQQTLSCALVNDTSETRYYRTLDSGDDRAVWLPNGEFLYCWFSGTAMDASAEITVIPSLVAV